MEIIDSINLPLPRKVDTTIALKDTCYSSIVELFRYISNYETAKQHHSETDECLSQR